MHFKPTSGGRRQAERLSLKPGTGEAKDGTKALKAGEGLEGSWEGERKHRSDRLREERGMQVQDKSL